MVFLLLLAVQPCVGEVVLRLAFDDPTYDYEFKRTLSYAVSGGADINECLEVSRSIVAGDGQSWYLAWNGLAERLELSADQALADGRRQTARSCWLRASNYHRTAEFFLHGEPDDPRILDSWQRSRAAFRQAAQLFETPVEIVAVPYQPDRPLPGYFLRPDDSKKARATLILQTGFDGTAEELYLALGTFALERGFNVLIFEGPGQGGALREQGLVFRADWEKVVTPVVDYALSRSDVDPARLALVGFSMGGYLAPRAAAFEPRLSALVANPGVYSMLAGTGPTPDQWTEMEENPEQANLGLRTRAENDVGFRWLIGNGMYTTGLPSPLAFLQFFRSLVLSQELVEQIACPTLVIASAGDHFAALEDQRRLYDALRGPKDLLIFGSESAARQHCQVGALLEGGAAILDWLEHVLN